MKYKIFLKVMAWTLIDKETSVQPSFHFIKFTGEGFILEYIGIGVTFNIGI